VPAAEVLVTTAVPAMSHIVSMAAMAVSARSGPAMDEVIGPAIAHAVRAARQPFAGCRPLRGKKIGL
jgi:hypothetical protein